MEGKECLASHSHFVGVFLYRLDGGTYKETDLALLVQ